MKLSFLLLLQVLFITHMVGQNGIDSPDLRQRQILYQEIKSADSAMFKALFDCDSLEYKKFFINDLSFYNQYSGLTYSLEKEMAGLKRACENGLQIRCELLESSLKVFELGKDGALESGIHRFWGKKGMEQENLRHEYQFIHIWKKIDGKWKISTIINYDDKISPQNK